MTRHIFGATDSPHVAVECQNKVIDDKVHMNVDKRMLKENFYMDDLVLSSNNSTELLNVMEQV